MAEKNQIGQLDETTAKDAKAHRYSASDLERIRELAYAAYSARLGGPGDALSDWLEAEQMFIATRNLVPDPPVSRSMPIQTIPTRQAEPRPPRRQRSGKATTV